jgi:hypothetical protein
MKSKNNNNDDDDDDGDDDNNNNTAMGSVHAWGDTFLTFGLKALTETNTSHLATGIDALNLTHAFFTTFTVPHTHTHTHTLNTCPLFHLKL